MNASTQIDRATVFDRIVRTVAYDWKNQPIPGALLSEVIIGAVAGGQRLPMTILGARVLGDLRLDAIGSLGEPPSLQILGCALEGGIAARQSRWLQLVIARSSVGDIDIPAAYIERMLIIEQVAAVGWLDMRDAQVGSGCSLNGSSFKAKGRGASVMLKDVRVGRNLTGRRLTASGGLDAERVRVEGDLALDGATLTADPNGRALGLGQARVGGRLRLCQTDVDCFTAAGQIHLDSAEVGALVMKGASVDGLGRAAVVADEIRVGGAVDLSGIEGDPESRFKAVGALRFGSARIGGQFQVYLADLRASADALILHGARIDGDVLIGHLPADTVIHGTLNMNALRLDGRLVVGHVGFTGPGDAMTVRQAAVTGEVECHDIEAAGPIRLDNLTAGGLSIERLRLDRDLPVVDHTGLPAHYAPAEHALLDLSFARLATDLRLEDVRLRGGDLRMIGVKVEAAVQLSRLVVAEVSGPAIIAQSAEIAGGLQIVGSPAELARIEGDLLAMSLQVGEDLTIAHVRFGNDVVTAGLVLRSAQIRSGLTLLGVEANGAVVASAASIGGDVHIHDSQLTRPGAIVLDLRGAVISGQLGLASLGPNGTSCRLQGQVTLEGASMSVLAWQSVVVGNGTLLLFSNVAVAQRISADSLIAEAEGHLSLAGTTVPLLEDRIDDGMDGWGGGKLGLNLEEFVYGRLTRPSGRQSDAPAEVHSWRAKWLGRRADASSARPVRHLANVLRAQGLVEASRLQLVDAFAAEGRLRPTHAGRMLSWLFGLLFGHGLSGSRAASTLLGAWLLGAAGVDHLQARDLLVPAKQDEQQAVSCSLADPFLFAADAMLPVDLGSSAKCDIGRGARAVVGEGFDVPEVGRTVFGEVETYRVAWSIYQLISWILVSLAVLTWSGLLKRGGRD